MEFPIVSSKRGLFIVRGRKPNGIRGGKEEEENEVKKNKEGEKENEVAPVETRKSVGKKRGRKGGKGWSVVVRNRKRR